MKKAKAENLQLVNLIKFLRKAANENDARIWQSIADALSKPRSQRKAINLSHINRNSKKDETVAVPGKVLGAGRLEHPAMIAAFSFSNIAKDKIRKSKGKCVTFHKLVETNPKGSNVKIVG